MVARSDAHPPGMRPIADSILTPGTHSWEEIGHEKIPTTIISLPLIQEGQLSVTGERMCTNDTGKLPLGGLPVNSVDRLTDLKSVEEP